jgi:hypothetical protein
MRASLVRRPSLILLVSGALIAAGCSPSITTNNNNGNCDNAGDSNSLNCSQTEASGPGAPRSPSATQQAARTGGKLLGSYTATLPDGYYVPIGPSSPVNSQLSTTGGGDLIYTTMAGSTEISPVTSQSTMASFSGTPTYRGCVDDTDEQPGVSASQGTSFCLYESGIIAGGIVVYINPTEINPTSVMVKITVWSH